MSPSLRHVFRSVLIVSGDRQVGGALRRCLAGLGCMTAGPFRDEAEAIRALDDAVVDAALIDARLASGAALVAALEREGVPLAVFEGFNASRGTLHVRPCQPAAPARELGVENLLDELLDPEGRAGSWPRLTAGPESAARLPSPAIRSGSRF